VRWHQDAPYWPLTPSRTVTVWLAIDDADVANGAMQVVPGSHRYGELPTRPSHEEEETVLWRTVDGIERLGQPHSITLRAGECSIHSDLLLHGSGRNRSERRRCGLTLRYHPPTVRSIKAAKRDHASGIVCRGRDPSGYWQHVPRPAGDDLGLEA